VSCFSETLYLSLLFKKVTYVNFSRYSVYYLAPLTAVRTTAARNKHCEKLTLRKIWTCGLGFPVQSSVDFLL